MDPKITYTNFEKARMFAYHEKTKHSYWSVRSSGHTLDWANQPNPFRYFKDTPVVSLPKKPALPEISSFNALERLGHIHTIPSTPRITPETISQLLYYSMAVSAWKQVRGTEFRYSLRVNPSSGNLHPTETYLAMQHITDLPDGLYHYRVLEHCLEQRRQGPAIRATAAAVGTPWLAASPLVIVLTSIFWRESWKYRDRAYRYCLLDLGHAAISILTAAHALGFDGVCLGHFADVSLAELLGVNVLDEGPLMVIALGTEPHLRETPSLGKVTMGPLQGQPNSLSAEETPYYLLQGMHQSTLLPPDTGPCPKVPPTQTETLRGVDTQRAEASVRGSDLPASRQAQAPIINLSAKPPRDMFLADVSRKRRSGLDFDPKASMTLDDLGALLGHAMIRIRADYHGNLDGKDFGHLIYLYLYVHRVEGLSPGVYRYLDSTYQLELIKTGDQRERAAYLSLEQGLAARACVVFSMIADLERAGKVFGNRGYRYAHFEAGMIGQALYLGAEALGLNATGMGAFYDDEVHKYLALSPDQGQVIYHFAVGKAVPDDRLITVGEEPGIEPKQKIPDLP